MDDVDVSVEEAAITAMLDAAEARELTRIVGRTFGDQEVFIDGRAFIDCTFRAGTVLVVRFGVTEFTNCKFPDPDETYRLTVSGPASVVSQLRDQFPSRASFIRDVGGPRPN